MFSRFFKKDATAKTRRVVVKAGAQYVDPTFSLTVADVDTVLQRANLTRSDLQKLLYDDEIFGACERRIAGILGNPWRLEGDNIPWLYDAVSNIFEAALRIIMQAKWLGASVGELIWAADADGIMRVQSIAPRKIERFVQRDAGLMFKEQGGTEILTLPEKVLYSGVNVHKDNPYGDALLSRVYWAWFNKNYGEQFWSRYAERHASPLTVIKSAVNTANADDARQELAALAAAAANAVADGTVAISDQDSIEFIEATNDGAAHQKFVTHQIRRIQKTLTGRVLTSELDSGSRAAQETDDGFTQSLLESDLTFCEAGINHIVDCLLTVNGLDPDGVYFAFERKKGIDKGRWERDVALINSGAITFTAQYYLDNYGLEAQHFTVNDKAEARMSLAAVPPAILNGSACCTTNHLTPGAQEVEDGVQRALATLPASIDADAIEQTINAASDEVDLMRRLALLYDDNDPSHYAVWLEQAMVLAMAQGYYQAAKDIV